MKLDWPEKMRSWWLPLAAFLVSFSAYLATLPQTVSFEDSAEFVTAAATWSIPHASGYPLYVLLAGLFTKLPFGPVPWRVALFSALTAAGAVAFLAVFARRLANRLLSFSSTAADLSILAVSLMFAFSGIWWSQAIYAKVYPLHVLLTLLVVYCGWRWAEEPEKSTWAVRCGAALGLSWANHLFLTAAQVPLLVLALAAGASDFRVAWRGVLKILSISALGLLFYGLILLRAGSAPFVTNPPASFAELVRYVLRSNYGDVGGIGWNKGALLMAMAWQWATALGPLGVALSVGGTVVTWRDGRRGSRFIALIFSGALSIDLLLTFARSNYWSETLGYVYRVFGLAAIVLGFLSAALAAAWLARRAAPDRRLRRPLPLALLALAMAAGLGNFGSIAPFRDDFADRYVRALLGTVPPGSVLVVNERTFTHDTFLFTLAYLQTVERLRPDVTVAQDADRRPFFRAELPGGYIRFDTHWRRKMLLRSVLKDPALAGRPIFATFIPTVHDADVPLTDGLVFSVRCPAGCGWQPEGHVLPVPPPKSAYLDQPALSAIYSHFLYAQSAVAAAAGDQRHSASISADAIAFDDEPMSDDYQALLAFRQEVARSVEKPAGR